MLPEKLYHGSPDPELRKLLPQVQPRRSGKPTAVYATPRRGLAIFFGLKGVTWKNIKRVGDYWEISGLTEAQLSQPSYLYHLPTDNFEHYIGWQYISHKSVRPISMEVIHDVGRELRELGFKIKVLEKVSAGNYSYSGRRTLSTGRRPKVRSVELRVI